MVHTLNSFLVRMVQIGKAKRPFQRVIIEFYSKRNINLFELFFYAERHQERLHHFEYEQNVFEKVTGMAYFDT